MIFDKLENAKKYFALHPGFEAAFNFLKQDDLVIMECMTYEIDGKNIYAMITNNPGKKKEEAKLEAHKKYIDIQFLMEGTEEIGWKAYDDCNEVLKEYSEEKDIEFFADEAQTYLNFTPHTFAIFYPEDAHAPMVADSNIHKVVIKVIVK